MDYLEARRPWFPWLPKRITGPYSPLKNLLLFLLWDKKTRVRLGIRTQQAGSQDLNIFNWRGGLHRGRNSRIKSSTPLRRSTKRHRFFLAYSPTLHSECIPLSRGPAVSWISLSYTSRQARIYPAFYPPQDGQQVDGWDPFWISCCDCPRVGTECALHVGAVWLNGYTI